jgi:hypothetical protein
MAREPMIFAWYAPASPDAFFWFDYEYNLKPHRPQLILAAGEGATFERYSPLSAETALYRELATTPPTLEGILQFVQRYGRLGGGMVEEEYLDGSPRHPLQFERFENYWSRIVNLAEAVRIWDLVRQGDKKELSKSIKWEEDGRVYYLSPLDLPEKLGIQEILGEPWLAQLLCLQPQNILTNEIMSPRGVPKGDVITPARIWVMAHVNRVLVKEVAPRLVWDGCKKRVAFQELPSSLLGAIYLQFAQAIHGVTSPQRCLVCSKWFDHARGKSRSDRLTCSHVCRTKAYRQRQQEARRLYAEGIKINAIAQKLGSTSERVRSWVSQ